jgi:hypothetical protein
VADVQDIPELAAHDDGLRFCFASIWLRYILLLDNARVAKILLLFNRGGSGMRLKKVDAEAFVIRAKFGH